jgi:hypothetical protein
LAYSDGSGRSGGRAAVISGNSSITVRGELMFVASSPISFMNERSIQRAMAA